MFIRNSPRGKRRVFVAINPDERTIVEIGGLVRECRGKLPRGIKRQIRFLPPENWHITLSFLGYQDEANVEKIEVALGETAKRFAPAEVGLESLVWGPLGRPPRMIWLLGDGETSKKLGEMKNSFEDLLGEKNVLFDRETRPFNAHITLARFDLRLPQPRPAIEKRAGLRFEAKSLDLVESRLERGGAKYEIVQEFPLKTRF